MFQLIIFSNKFFQRTLAFQLYYLCRLVSFAAVDYPKNDLAAV